MSIFVNMDGQENGRTDGQSNPLVHFALTMTDWRTFMNSISKTGKEQVLKKTFQDKCDRTHEQVCVSGHKNGVRED